MPQRSESHADRDGHWSRAHGCSASVVARTPLVDTYRALCRMGHRGPQRSPVQGFGCVEGRMSTDSGRHTSCLDKETRTRVHVTLGKTVDDHHIPNDVGTPLPAVTRALTCSRLSDGRRRRTKTTAVQSRQSCLRGEEVGVPYGCGAYSTLESGKRGSSVE